MLAPHRTLCENNVATNNINVRSHVLDAFNFFFNDISLYIEYFVLCHLWSCHGHSKFTVFFMDIYSYYKHLQWWPSCGHFYKVFELFMAICTPHAHKYQNCGCIMDFLKFLFSTNIFTYYKYFSFLIPICDRVVEVLNFSFTWNVLLNYSYHTLHARSCHAYNCHKIKNM